MADSVFEMSRCSGFDEWHKDRPDKKDRATYAFIVLTDEEAHKHGLTSSKYVYDRGDPDCEWVLRVPLSEVEDAPCCEKCGAFRLDLETEWYRGDAYQVCPPCSLRSQREEARLEWYLGRLHDEC